MFRHMSAAVAALLWLCAAPCAGARPFTIDDLLHQESLGEVAIDPTGRWVVFEARDPYDNAARFDYDQSNGLTLGRLRLAEVQGEGPARPLLAEDPGPGVAIGAFSPRGGHLAIYRLADRRWTLGIVTVATGAVRWLDLTPQDAGRGRDLQWVSEDTLLVIHQPDRRPPSGLRAGWVIADRLPRYWAAAATSVGAHSVFGSGAAVEDRARPAPGELRRVNAATGEQKVLATGPFIDLEIAPDRRRVALFSAGPNLQPRPGGPVRGPAGLETEATRLSILDLATGRLLPACPACDMLPQLLSWSPDSRTVMGLARGADGLWTSGDLLTFDARSGAHTRRATGLQLATDLNPVTVWTAWMGADPVVFARHPGATAPRNDWFRLTPHGPVNLTAGLTAPSKRVRVADAGRLLVLDGDAVWEVSGRGAPRRRSTDAVSAAERPPRPWDGARLDRAPPAALWLSAGRDDHRTLHRLEAAGRSTVIAAPATAGAVWAAGAATALLYAGDDHGVERLSLVRRGAPPRPLAILNAGLAATDAPQVRPVQHRGLDGAPLTSWLYLPRPATDGRPPPVIVRPYLGDTYPAPPGDRYLDSGFQQNLRMLTGHGYAVLVPSLPNPPGGMTDPAAGLADRILSVLDAAAGDPALKGTFDPDRAALLGWSFGGYTVMTTITQTRRFRAAVAMNGISDLTALWSTLPLRYQVDPEAGYMSNWNTGGVEATQPKMLGPPWAERDRYVRNSPLYAADKIETPLLLLHGGQDTLPVSQSEAMYSALFRQGKDAELVIYWGAQHSVRSPGDVRDLYARTFAFLDAHLGVTPLSPISGMRGAPPANPGPASASTGPRPRRSPPRAHPSPSPTR